MSLTPSRFRVPALAGLMLLALGIAVTARAPQGTEKHVIVTVLDDQNKPVAGLHADAFHIREDNVDRDIVKVEPATDPIAIVFFVDTTSAFYQKERDLRTSSQSFIKDFLAKNPGSALALWEFGGADIPVVDFTTDALKLSTAAGKLTPKGSLTDTDMTSGGSAARTLNPGQNITGSNLVEGISGAAKVLAKRPEQRRIIFAFSSDAAVEMSQGDGHQAQDDVQKANATLFAVSIQALASNGPLRDQVLTNVTSYSGGKRITIGSITALEEALRNVADILAAQYVVTFTRPSATAKVLQVGITGFKGNAPHWAPK